MYARVFRFGKPPLKPSRRELETARRQIRWWPWLPLLGLVALAFPIGFVLGRIPGLGAWGLPIWITLLTLTLASFVGGRIWALPPAVYARYWAVHLIPVGAIIGINGLFGWGLYRGQAPWMARSICGEWIMAIQENLIVGNFIALATWLILCLTLQSAFQAGNRAYWRRRQTGRLEPEWETQPGWDHGQDK